MKFNVLALDGGGMRGVITAVWLAEIERRIRRPLNKVVDLVAGTSTGSILATCIALGMPASNAVELYKKSGPVIFPSGWKFLTSKIKRFFTQGLDNSKYDGVGLEKELRSILGDLKLSDLQIKTMLVSYDAYYHEALMFKSWHEEFADLLIWEAVKASASAPTYFPATVLNLNEKKIVAIDGGLVDNNPASCALAEALRISGCASNEIYLASFGTGKYHPPVTVEEGESWGTVRWVSALFDAFMDGSSSASEYFVNSVLEHRDRVQVDLDEKLIVMDDASLVNDLIEVAQKFIDQNPDAFARVAQMLLRDR